MLAAVTQCNTHCWTSRELRQTMHFCCNLIASPLLIRPKEDWKIQKDNILELADTCERLCDSLGIRIWFYRQFSISDHSFKNYFKLQWQVCLWQFIKAAVITTCSNQFTLMMVAVSCSHIITICHLFCLFPTSKVNGEDSRKTEIMVIWGVTLHFVIIV